MNFLKRTLAEFDGVFKVIIMCRCIVSLNYGIDKSIDISSLDSDVAFIHTGS